MPETRIFQDLPILAIKIEIKHQLPQEGNQINVVVLYLNINYELRDPITRLRQDMLDKELMLTGWHKTSSKESALGFFCQRP